ncbi:hypothetical protein [Sulfurovum sp.]|uniref:hypothetical protein n=1 Tax=Sulfurovum sp. TaxID=1969726 RepID=UPI003568415B
MKIISCKNENMNDHGKSTTCNVYSIHVKINDIGTRAKEMILTLSDTSWINKLDFIPKTSYEARAERTIEKLIHDILMKVANDVTAEFGEFLISVSAQDVLESNFKHSKIPLAELLKEKVSGNPGFDFHTESATNLIAFGEAKYSGIVNKHNTAIKQIKEFIDLRKDDAELVDLQHFVTLEAIENYKLTRKAYVAAFSINDKDPTSVIHKALTSKHIDHLLAHKELYIIGIEIDGK